MDRCGKEKRALIKNQFNKHCERIREKIAEAAQSIDALNTDLFEHKKENGTHWWRLASWCRVEDVMLFNQGKELLTALKKQLYADPELLKQVNEICEKAYVNYKGEFLAYNRQQGQLSSHEWAKEPIQEYIRTFLAMLTHLAHETLKAGEREQQEAKKQAHLQREAQIWEDCVLCYAHVRFELSPIAQERLDEQSEIAVCRCLALYRQLNRPLAAEEFLSTLTTVMQEEEPSWEPSTRIQRARQWLDLETKLDQE